MVLNTGNITLPAGATDAFLNYIEKGSAFQQAAVRVPLPGTGTVTNIIGRGDAAFVGEGGRKPTVNPGINSQVFTAAKLARIVTISKELKDDAQAINQLLQTEAVGSLSRSFDKAVAGTLTTDIPANFDRLDQGTDTVHITDYTSFLAALSSVEENDRDVTAFVLSRPLLRQLQGKVNNSTGRSILNITATDIEGIPYYTFTSSVATGFMGDFNRARWGVVNNGIEVAVSEEAAVTIDGQLVSLYENNLVAIRVEARYGFRVYDKADFKQVVTTPAS